MLGLVLAPGRSGRWPGATTPEVPARDRNPPPPPGFHPSSIGAPSRRGCIAVPEEAFPLHRVCALRDLLNGAGIQKTQAVGLALPLTRWVAPTSAGPRVPHVRTSPCPSFLSSQQAREVLGPPPSPPVTLTFLRQGKRGLRWVPTARHAASARKVFLVGLRGRTTSHRPSHFMDEDTEAPGSGVTFPRPPRARLGSLPAPS